MVIFSFFLGLILLIHPVISSEVEYNLSTDIYYKKYHVEILQQNDALFTFSHPPTKTRNKKNMDYEEDSQIPSYDIFKENILTSHHEMYQIIRTDHWPDCIHGRVDVTFKSERCRASGVMVGPHHFLTAAHCVYNLSLGGWAKDIKVCIGLNGEYTPFGTTTVAKIYTYKEWFVNQDAEYDIALLVLKHSIGYETGWASLLCLGEQGLQEKVVYMTGYPANKGCAEMWEVNYTLKEIYPEFFLYQSDAFKGEAKGQSGGAVSIKKWGVPHVLGVHSRVLNGQRYGVRLSHDKFFMITSWISNTAEMILSQRSEGVVMVWPERL